MIYALLIHENEHFTILRGAHTKDFNFAEAEKKFIKQRTEAVGKRPKNRRTKEGNDLKCILWRTQVTNYYKQEYDFPSNLIMPSDGQAFVAFLVRHYGFSKINYETVSIDNVYVYEWE